MQIRITLPPPASPNCREIPLAFSPEIRETCPLFAIFAQQHGLERTDCWGSHGLAEARRAGYLQNRKLRVALDTTPILGKGAVQDTYNLLGEGIERLGRRLAEVEKEEVTGWAEK
jgi:hypothetical protein